MYLIRESEKSWYLKLGSYMKIDCNLWSCVIPTVNMTHSIHQCQIKVACNWIASLKRKQESDWPEVNFLWIHILNAWVHMLGAKTKPNTLWVRSSISYAMLLHHCWQQCGNVTFTVAFTWWFYGPIHVPCPHGQWQSKSWSVRFLLIIFHERPKV